jgi:F-box and WD-40 domain protein 1/11
MRSLRTSSIAQIVDKLNPLLHIDPILHLPAEVAQEIFAYLDQKSLIVTTTLSKSWRIQASDPHIWKHLFASEGWKADYKRVWDFEEAQRERSIEKHRERKSRARPSDAVSDVESKSPKKRVRETHLLKSSNDDTVMADAASSKNAADVPNSSPNQWNEQHGNIEVDEDDKMEDISNETLRSEEDDAEGLPNIQDRVSYLKTLRTSSPKDTIFPPIKPSLLTTGFGSSPQINWQYLYKQRRRLEDNWKAGRFTNFILPHPSHPHEAHTECIYTIQYVGKHLVSGSRDKTIRVWNLDTQRLIHPPLRGHGASVLCLQFDMRPSEDVIISGGGDCSVILWKFSTGKLLRKIENAHAESVLNLRFDARHLITCSKDRTIKIWNRHSLLPTDEDYPVRGTSSSARWPAHIIDVTEEVARHTLNLQRLPEYSLLMTLTGHTAAVNAIQVLDGQIVSASGDRHIKVWDIKTGMCVKTIYGHQKGIACVQFDGRRIVSGSSDVTVRIFDAVSSAEVACLRGHTDLVRTVQARFSDVKSNVKEEEAEARRIDQEFLHAKANDRISDNLTRDQWKARNAGSKDLNDIFAYGAKLPPGGGGNKWARIVSGSYDETIIIWNRDQKGKWEPLHQLTQWEAILRAGGQPRNIPPAHQANPDIRRRGATRPNAVQLAAQQQRGQNLPHIRQRVHGQTRPGRAAAAVPVQVQVQVQMQTNPPPGPAIAGNATGTQLQHPQTTTTVDEVRANGGSASAVVQRPVASSSDSHTPQHPLPHRPVQPSAQPSATTTTAGAATATTLTPTRPAATGQAPQTAHAPANAAGAQAATQHQRDVHHQRIYKLQFCSRRLLCCSMEPIIVGWDFAAGDKEIEIASEFFGEDVEG